MNSGLQRAEQMPPARRTGRRTFEEQQIHARRRDDERGDERANHAEQNRRAQETFRAKERAAKQAASATNADSNQNKPRQPTQAEEEGEGEAKGEGKPIQGTEVVTGPAPSATAPAPAGLVDSSVLDGDSSQAMVDFFAEDLAGQPPKADAKPAKAPPPAFNGQNADAIPERAAVTLAKDFELPEEWGNDAIALGWTAKAILREAEKFRQYWFSGAGKGTRSSVKGWKQRFSNWLEKAIKMNPNVMGGSR